MQYTVREREREKNSIGSKFQNYVLVFVSFLCCFCKYLISIRNASIFVACRHDAPLPLTREND